MGPVLVPAVNPFSAPKTTPYTRLKPPFNALFRLSCTEMAEKRTGGYSMLGDMTTAPVAYHIAATDSSRAQCEDLEKVAGESQDISYVGGAKEDGYVIIKNAIRKDIIATTEVDKGDPKVAKDGRRRCFQTIAPDEKN
ncbi:hypothetical protein K469DRAFT_276975 [Zopfia rhizophila CBS 207.26]|uniref:Uncharacterized protein n=1 Tax=Zopfia rhizophila CBS 207.26 TaxID=1314779 RepID=A0A6A6DQR5_9PEZI|nr:hypothetical protein K469DRAFT_276975 [Zopfia rhizophila CBS 207.26]